MSANVTEIYDAALSLKADGQSLATIVRFILAEAKEDGLDTSLTVNSYGCHIVFGNGERITFDGTAWHHQQS